MKLDVKNYIENEVVRMRELVETLAVKPKLVLVKASNDGASEKYINNFVIKNENKTGGEDENLLSWSVVTDKWTFIEGSGAGNKFAYVIELEPNKSLGTTDFVANDGKVTVSKYITAEDLEEMKKIGDIYINFKAYAVQAGDMDALEAWNKVK
jgi:hypothetical protein